MKKNEAIGNNNRRIFPLVDYIAPDITGELEVEREDMLEKWESVTVVTTGIDVNVLYLSSGKLVL